MRYKSEMNLREAAQQALEACEQRLPLVGQHIIIDELNTLRAALAEPDYWQEEARRYASNAEYWRKRYEAFAEPEQPVAWMQIGIGDHEGTRIAVTSKPKQFNPEWWRFEPLYTASPKRKRLTDEEIGLIWKTLCSDDFIVFARAIERAPSIGGKE